MRQFIFQFLLLDFFSLFLISCLTSGLTVSRSELHDIINLKAYDSAAFFVLTLCQYVQ